MNETNVSEVVALLQHAKRVLIENYMSAFVCDRCTDYDGPPTVEEMSELLGVSVDTVNELTAHRSFIQFAEMKHKTISLPIKSKTGKTYMHNQQVRCYEIRKAALAEHFLEYFIRQSRIQKHKGIQGHGTG